MGSIVPMRTRSRRTDRDHEGQALSRAGLPRLSRHPAVARSYGSARIEAACRRGNDIGATTYGSIKSVNDSLGNSTQLEIFVLDFRSDCRRFARWTVTLFCRHWARLSVNEREAIAPVTMSTHMCCICFPRPPLVAFMKTTPLLRRHHRQTLLLISEIFSTAF
jgi:hypothetical protein